MCANLLELTGSRSKHMCIQLHTSNIDLGPPSVASPRVAGTERPCHPPMGRQCATESLTGIEHDVQIDERTKHAMENYSQWLQNAISAFAWSNTELNKKLLSYATESVAISCTLVEGT